MLLQQHCNVDIYCHQLIAYAARRPCEASMQLGSVQACGWACDFVEEEAAVLRGVHEACDEVRHRMVPYALRISYAFAVRQQQIWQSPLVCADHK